MPVEISQWRAEIGAFYIFFYTPNYYYNSKIDFKCDLTLVFLLGLLLLFVLELTNKKFQYYNEFLISQLLYVDFFIENIYQSLSCLSLFICYLLRILRLNFDFIYLLIFMLLLLCGDIELNPGPNERDNLTMCHWNLNSIAAHNFIKMKSLQAYNSIQKFDIICLSETYLDKSYCNDCEDININGYKWIRADNPQNTKRGGVCLYYKEHLPIKILNFHCLSECIVCEFSYLKKKCFIASLYRSPSQTSDEFELFISKFDNLLGTLFSHNPYLVFILGDFNARSSSWWSDDINTTEGTHIDSLTSFYGLQQLISQPTHILPNSSSCIDLIFTNQPNMVYENGVHSSLHQNCHHQIIYAKVNMKVYYPPPYKRLVWNYDKANVDAIRKTIKDFKWEDAFCNINVDEQISLFNNTLLNIFSNFIPSKTIVCNDSDPPWMNQNIKNIINRNNIIYKDFLKNSKSPCYYQRLENARRELSEMIRNAKDDYYSQQGQKLNNPATSAKTYWSILKSLFLGKKVPLIPPLLIDGHFVTDFKQKAELFNDFFANQCKTINNNSTLPEHFVFYTDKHLSSIDFDKAEVTRIIKKLDPNKAHGYDGISIKMLKICGDSISKPLTLIFKNCLQSGTFPNLWKKANIVPIHKKNDKQIISNYRPVSLLPICGKIFERIIYDSLFSFFTANNLITTNQSGFRPGDSCIHQLISITHNIYNSFDCNPSLEVRGVFLDISKAFDRVWHEALIYKLKCNGVSGNILCLISSFLSDRYQRVVLNGQSSTWAKLHAGVPQGSILGPLFFLMYINDLPHGLVSDCKMFADDTSLFSVVHDTNDSAKDLNHDLKKIQNWAKQWKMSFNPDPAKQAQEVIFSRKNKKYLILK